jgi:putative redox protein
MTEGWTEITAEWKNDNTFIGQNESGGTVQIGELNGNPGIGPMQLLLVALAGCTGSDIVSILHKKRIKIIDFKLQVRGKRASDYPMVWTDIHNTYFIWSEELSAKDVEQAIQLSEDKYCSVGIMLGKTAKISSEYHILKPGENAE